MPLRKRECSRNEQVVLASPRSTAHLLGGVESGLGLLLKCVQTYSEELCFAIQSRHIILYINIFNPNTYDRLSSEKDTKYRKKLSAL